MHEQKFATDKQKLLACAGGIYLKSFIARYSSTLTKGNAFFLSARSANINCKFWLATTEFYLEVTEFVTKTTICDMGIDKNSRLC